MTGTTRHGGGTPWRVQGSKQPEDLCLCMPHLDCTCGGYRYGWDDLDIHKEFNWYPVDIPAPVW